MAFTSYLIVPLLIPVLTDFPLPLGYMGDILGGGLILALAGFAVALAAAETSDPYAQLGSSRAMTFGALIEPSVLFVVFTVALITTTDLPYAMAAVDRSSLAQVLRAGARVHGRCLLPRRVVRHRKDPGRNSHQYARVRHDRRGEGLRAFRGLRLPC